MKKKNVYKSADVTAVVNQRFKLKTSKYLGLTKEVKEKKVKYKGSNCNHYYQCTLNSFPKAFTFENLRKN